MPAGRVRVGQSNMTMKGSLQGPRGGKKGVMFACYSTYIILGCIHLSYLLGLVYTIEYFAVNSYKELDYTVATRGKFAHSASLYSHKMTDQKTRNNSDK